MDNNYVDQYYQMDPNTDDLIRGSELRNGMRVLFEDPTTRLLIDPKGELTNKQRSVTDKWNRWCIVSDLRTEGRTSYFIGLYDDGTKFTFARDLNNGWYVKKDSIPSVKIHDCGEVCTCFDEVPAGFKHEMELNVFNLVKERLLKLNTDQYHGNLIDFSEEAKDLTNEITEIFKKEITAFVNQLKREMRPGKGLRTQKRNYATIPRRCFYCVFGRCEEAKKNPSGDCPCCIAQHDEANAEVGK